MQELIDELKLIEAYPMSPLVLRMATDLLEKEKEQMIVFGKKMQLVQHVSYDDDITYCFEPEQYYNQTYTQNELPKTYINGVEVDSDNSSVTTTGVWTPKTN